MSALKLPDLPYSYDALAPHMSRETFEYHHGKHHKAYVDTANKLLEDSALAGSSLEEIVKESFGSQAALFNNAAQHYNHCLFWNCMKPNGGGAMPGELETAINDAFGSTDAFFEKFSAEGKAQFGSGWVWLVKQQDGGLGVMRTPNGENPLVHNATPVLGCDVWEHSYYLDHRNDRGGYLDTFLNKLANWEYVADQLNGA